MRPHLRYAAYVLRHKWFVFVAGLRVGAPVWRLIIHDWSKFTPIEWTPYVYRFYKGWAGRVDKTGDPDEFQRAWTHHWHTNAHHWEHWLTLDGRGALVPLQMPERFAREMVADWMGAGRAINGRWEVREWYEEHRERMQLAPETKEFVEKMLQRPETP